MVRIEGETEEPRYVRGPQRRAGVGTAKIEAMCNSYRITPKKRAKGLTKKVSDAAGRLPGSLVRKSDPGIVVLADERVEVVRRELDRFAI